jgi:hypothetical protein
MRSRILSAIIVLMAFAQTLFAAVPAITTFSPAQGPVGTLVTVTGTNLGSSTAFSIGGVTAVVVTNTGTTLVGFVMPGATTGIISITTPGGSASSPHQFTVTPTTYPTTQQGPSLIANESLALLDYAEQGASVALSADGNTALVGAPNNQGGIGASFVYTRTGGTWTQQAALVGTGESSDYSMQGNAVALSADGNTAMIAGHLDGYGGIGAIWFFTRSGTTWTQQGNKVVGTNVIGASSYQGNSVALSADGNTAVEGGPYDNSSTGAVWVFTRSNGAWTQAQKVIATGTTGSTPGFGSSIGLSADANTMIVGATGDNAGMGACWIFTRSSNTYTQQGNKLVGSGTSGAAAQGTAAAISANGNVVSFTAPNANGAWVFTRTGTVWSQLGAEFVFGGGSPYVPSQGTAVGMSADGNTLLIGGSGNGNGEGATWLFVRSGNTYNQIGNPIYGAQTGGGSNQGAGVAVSANGTTGIIGAPGTNNDQGLAFVLTPVLPGAVTELATNVTATSGTIVGEVTPNGITTTVNFEYGTDPNLDGATSTTTFNLGANPLAGSAGTTGYSSALTGLTPNTTYYYSVNALNVNGAAYGNILSFTTPAGPLQSPVITFPALATVTYGAADITPGATSTNTVTPIIYVSSNTTVATITPSGTIHIAGAGTVQITAEQVAGNGYAGGSAMQMLTILPAPLTITANDQNRPYGGANPPLTLAYSGLVNGDTQANLTTQPVVYTTATAASVAGPYPITVSGAADPNYTITFVQGTLTVTSLPPIAVTQAATGIGSNGATLNGTVSDGGSATTVQFIFGTDPHLSNASTLAVTTGVSPIPGGGGTTAFTELLSDLTPGTTYYYEITGTNSAGGIGGGIMSFTTAVVPVAVITFTAPAGAVYGSADLTPNGTSNNTGSSITYTSNNNSVANITGSGTIHIAGAGTAQITASQAAGNGYTAASPVTITFTVTPAPLTVTASSTTAVYGAVIPPLSVTYSGFAGNDSIDSLTTRATVSTTATGSSGVGNYPTTASGTVDPNYTIIYVAGNLSITPAALTITANNQSMAAGSAVPALTVSYAGFVNDDDAGNLTKQPTLSTTATSSSSAGTYPITASGAVDANYTISYVPGILTVGAPFAFNALPAKTYGDPDFSPGATGTAVTYASSNTGIAGITDGGSIHIVGAGTAIITATSNGASLQQALTVLPAPLTITANDLSRVYNVANPAFTFTYTGFVYTDDAASLTAAPVGASTANTASDAGSYPITVSGASDPDYTITYVAGTLSVTKAPQTIDFAAIPNQSINARYDLSGISASSGLPVSFALSDPSIAMISAAALVSQQVGSETLTASQPGDDNYLPAANVAQTFAIADDSGNDIIVNQVVSPNGDGIDDILNIKNIENYPKNKLALVNRDGVMIYQAEGYNNTTTAFNGHSNITGSLQQQGTLLYILEYWINGEYHRKTGFTVLRY